MQERADILLNVFNILIIYNKCGNLENEKAVVEILILDSSF